MSDIQNGPGMGEGKGGNRKGKIALFIFTGLLLAGGVAGIIIYHYKQTHVTTDDSFVKGTVYTISPKAKGTVQAVLADDNEEVKKGDLLVRINPERYEVRLQEAEAGLESSRKMYLQAEKAVEAGNAALALAEAKLSQAKIDYGRAKKLYKSAVSPKSAFDSAKTAFDVAVAARAAKKAEVASLTSSLATAKAGIRAASALVANAKLNIKYTFVKAPGDGFVTQKNVEVGNFVSVGQPLMALVSTEKLWVVANYKETQIEHMKVGDKVIVRIDTYPGEELKGSVESFMAGTGSAFSLFPAENATGNYVKVVQRVPVKIVFDGPLPEGVSLRVGMSVVPTVLVSR